MSELRLTPKQLNILRFIDDFYGERGVAPTLEEIAEEFQVNKVTIHGHLVELEKKGAVQRQPRLARSIRVVQPPPSRSSRTRPTKLRVAGTIAAGQPIEAMESPELFDLAELIPNDREVFLLRVRGDSMIDDQIRDGDFVLVEKRDTAHNGEIVVALTPDNEATLKRFYREKNHIRLQPANSNHQPIIVDDVSIRGVVIAVIRQMS